MRCSSFFSATALSALLLAAGGCSGSNFDLAAFDDEAADVGAADAPLGSHLEGGDVEEAGGADAAPVDTGVLEAASDVLEVDSGVLGVDTGVLEVDSGALAIDSGALAVDSDALAADTRALEDGGAADTAAVDTLVAETDAMSGADAVGDAVGSDTMTGDALDTKPSFTTTFPSSTEDRGAYTAIGFSDVGHFVTGTRVLGIIATRVRGTFEIENKISCGTLVVSMKVGGYSVKTISITSSTPNSIPIDVPLYAPTSATATTGISFSVTNDYSSCGGAMPKYDIGRLTFE